MSRVIDAVFRLTDEFSGPLKTIQTGLSDVGRQGKNVRRQVTKTGQSLATTGKVMTATVTTPLLVAGRAAVQYAGDVSKSMSLAKATIGITEETMGEWQLAEQAAMDAAANHIFTMEDASDAMLNFARQGYDAAQIANLMGSTMDYAQGTGTDLAETASGIGNALKGFGMDASLENVVQTFDQLAKAQSLANTDGSLLLDGVQRMAPIMATLGYDVGDAAALIGAWGDANIDAAEAATTWKTSVMRLASPTKQARDAMDELGISMFDEEGHTKDLIELQRELHDTFAELSEQEAMTAASKVFGKNQGDKMLALLRVDPEHLAELRNGIAESANMSQSLSESMGESLGGALDSLTSSIDVLKYSLGDLLGQYIEPLIRNITDLVDNFRALDEETQTQILRWAGIAAAAGPVLILVGGAVKLFAGLAGVFATVSAAGGVIPAVIGAITSPAGIAIGVIAGLVAVGVLLYKNWDKVKEKLEPVTQALEGAFGRIQPLLDDFKAALGGLWVTVRPVARVIGKMLVEAFGLFEGAIGVALIAQIELVSTTIESVTGVATALIKFITDVFQSDWKSAWEDIGKVFSAAFGPVLDLISRASEGIKGLKQSLAEKWAASEYNWANWGWGGNSTGDGPWWDETPGNASGTSYWQGGLTRVGESGGEIINLPSGTQIIPHDASLNTPVGGSSIVIPKLADQIIVREDADIDRIVDALCRNLIRARDNMGAYSMA